MDDSQVQRLIIVFDHCVGMLEPDGNDEILIYHLITCFFTVLKVEKGYEKLTFLSFLCSCTKLSSYTALHKHLAPELEFVIWTPQIFQSLEKEILSTLKFKTSFVSVAEIIQSFTSNFKLTEHLNYSNGHADATKESELIKYT